MGSESAPKPLSKKFSISIWETSTTGCPGYSDIQPYWYTIKSSSSSSSSSKQHPLQPQPSIREFRQISLELHNRGFTSLDLATIIFFLRSKVVSLASNSPTWRIRSLYLYPPVTGWPSYNPSHHVPFPSPSPTRRATVEVFYHAFIWDIMKSTLLKTTKELFHADH
jgi:hypothetical protein